MPDLQNKSASREKAARTEGRIRATGKMSVPLPENSLYSLKDLCSPKKPKSPKNHDLLTAT